MDQDTRQANVVLTADTSDYDTQIQQSARQTRGLSDAVDHLGQKLADLSKRAGRKLEIFAAADTASIVAATAAYASFEHQLTSLKAQADVLNGATAKSDALFKTYTKTVQDMRREFPTTTADAAALVQVLTKFTGTSAGLENLARTFYKAQGATGESATAIATSMLGLQKIMGTNVGQTAAYTDQLVTLAAKTPASAAAIADFAAQLGPVGKVAGFTQTQITGVSTAFLRAGQDGQQAATAFTKMLTDVTYAAQTGSPDLNKYAALVGMTADQFKSMDKAEAIVRIFESLNKMGPDAIQTLNRLGLDGVRTIRGITAVANQQGGIRGAIVEAQNAYGNGAVDRGAESGFSGLTNSMIKLREEMKKIAEEVGSTFAPMMDKFVQGVTVVARAVDSFLNGPAGKLLTWAMAIAAPIASLGGGLLLAAGALAKFASFAFVARGGLFTGFRDAYRGNILGPPMGPGAPGVTPARQFTVMPWARNRLGDTGTSVAAGEGGMMSRSGYIAGNAAAAMLFTNPRTLAAAETLRQQAMAAPFRAATFGFNTLGWMMQPGTRAGWTDATTRPALLPSAASMGQGISRMAEPLWWASLMRKGTTPESLVAAQRAAPTPGMTPAAYARTDPRMAVVRPSLAEEATGTAGSSTAAKMTAQNDAVMKATKATEAEAAARVAATRESGVLARALAGTARAAGSFGGTMAKVAGNIGMVGMMGAGKLGASALANPFMAAMMGLMVVPPLISMLKGPGDQTSSERVDMNPFTQAYASANGQAPSFTPQQAITAQVPKTTSMRQLRMVSSEEINAATSGAYQYKNGDIDKFDDSDFSGWKRQISAEMVSARGMSPQARNDIVMDTIKKFGPNAAQDMATMLATGNFTIDYTSMFSSMDGKSNEDRAQIGQGLLEAMQQQSGGASGVSKELGSRTKFIQLNNLLEAYSTTDTDQMAEAEKNIRALGLLGKDFSLTGAQAGAINQLTTGDAGTQAGGGRYGAPPGQSLTNYSPEERAKMTLSAAIQTMSDTDKKSLIASSAGQLNAGMSPEKMAEVILGMGTASPSGAQVYRAQLTGLQSQLQGVPFADIFSAPGIARAETTESGNTSAQFRQIVQTYAALKDQGLAPGEIGGAAQVAAGQIGDTSRLSYQIFQGVAQLATQNVQNQLPYVSRSAGYGMVTSNIQNQLAGVRATMDTNPEEAMSRLMDLKQQQKDVNLQQYEYYKNIALQSRELTVSQNRAEIDFGVTKERMAEQFNISRSRAEEDYNLQRKYEEQDYQLSRQRQEQDYEISRNRAQQSYDRSTQRSTSDYYLSRRRQEADFNHSVEVMTAEAAKNQLNIYERVTAQRTTSASTLLVNAKDQLSQMRGQESNLDKLRQMGLSDQAIQQLGFTDPQNAQQLARFMQDVMQNPALIGEFNKQIRKRVKAAGELVTDQSSMDWKEFTRQYNLARERGAEDFQRAMKRAARDFQISMKQNEDDFRRGLARQQDDYDRMLDRQATQFHTAMDRQEADYDLALSNMEDDFDKSMRRAVNDLNRMATDITGQLPAIQEKALKYLKGTAREQAKEVLSIWREMKTDTFPILDALAQMIENKLGIPLVYHHMGHSGDPDPNGARGGGSAGRTMPQGVGRTTRKNDKNDPEVIFFPLPQGQYSIGQPYGVPGDYASGYHTGQDFPAAVGTPIYAIMDGEVEYAGWGGDYGNFTKLYHGDDNQGRSVETWYAHQNNQSVRVGDEVDGGHRIGAVGWSGNVKPKSPAGAHLHLEYRIDGDDKDPMILLSKGGYTLKPGTEPGHPGLDVQKLLAKVYPKLEKAAAKIKQGGGYEYGDWSSSLNWTAVQRLREIAERKGISFSNLMDAGGHAPGDMPTPTNTSAEANMKLGRQMMLKMYPGWQGEWPALRKLWTGESGWSETADNPNSSAYGIPQALPGSKMASAGADWLTNPATQIKWGLNYIHDRYGDPRNAWQFWNAQDPHWYNQGSVFQGPRQIGVGEHGPELVLPLNQTGSEFIASLLRKVSPGLDARGMNAGHSSPMSCSHLTQNYKVDHRTQYLGDISVAAQDPNEFEVRMRMRQRHQNLSQPALATR